MVKASNAKKGWPWPERSWTGIGCWSRPAGRRPPLVRALAPEQRQQLREDMGELLLLLAGAVGAASPARSRAAAERPGGRLLPRGTVPRALWRQRVELARSAGHAEEARDLEDRVPRQPRRSRPRDRYLFLLDGIPAAGTPPRSLALVAGSQPPSER